VCQSGGMECKNVLVAKFASDVNGKALRFPTQATERLRAFHHITFIVLASLGK
jgi:hypothetical protein